VSIMWKHKNKTDDHLHFIYKDRVCVCMCVRERERERGVAYKLKAHHIHWNLPTQ
jgi:hypothetical protein